MKGVNRVTLIGTLGRDPELKFTPGGSPVCNFSVATNEEWFDKKSEQKQKKLSGTTSLSGVGLPNYATST